MACPGEGHHGGARARDHARPAIPGPSAAGHAAARTWRSLLIVAAHDSDAAHHTMTKAHRRVRRGELMPGVPAQRPNALRVCVIAIAITMAMISSSRVLVEGRMTSL